MRRADAAPGIPVKVLMVQEQVSKVGIAREPEIGAVAWTPTLSVW